MTLIAHDHTASAITNFLDKPTHALELLGPSGSGKGYIARHIAAQLLDVDSSKLVDHPYFICVDPRNDKVGIEDIRSLQKDISLTIPGKRAVRRVVLLENFDAFKTEAQNAMLKTLEEPPEDTVLILTTSRYDKVLHTVHSRCRAIRILMITEAALQQAELPYKKEDIHRAYLLSKGEVGLCFSLLNHSQDHPLVAAIEVAKQLLRKSRYERLCSVDKLIKDQQVPINDVLDALYRVLDATKASAISKNGSELETILKKMERVQQSIQDIEAGASKKLVLTDLFYHI